MYLYLYLSITVACAIEARFSLFNAPMNCGENKALDGFLIKRITVKSKARCALSCMNYENCTSINIKKITDKMFRCELNNNNNMKQPCSRLVHKANYRYYERVS